MADTQQRPDWEAGGFGLYIHWPFCAAKCPYCDFNSHVATSIDQRRWANCYISELRRYAQLTGTRTLQTVFFGGGTPSLMHPETVAEILDEVRRLWPMSNDPEITLEANPTSVEAGRFVGYRDAGVSRISIGFQAFNDIDLRRLGRLHTVSEARAAFDLARETFSRVSFDLIYARQDQTLQDWKSELSIAVDLAADHLSLYQLTIEPNTAFGERYSVGKLRGLPDEDVGADMYEATQEICDSAGLPAYEISNHARVGSESRHNLIYWRYGDYIGVGPGAHGRLTIDGQRYATETDLQPGKWLKAVEEAGSGEAARNALSIRDQAVEYMMMSLRLSEGADLNRLKKMRFSLNSQRTDQLVDLGLIEVTPDRIRTTAAGQPVLNGVLRELLVD